ncbi:MAG: SpoIID/LytB domain-containing protein [Candidatus Nanopelagicales bacterium]
MRHLVLESLAVGIAVSLTSVLVLATAPAPGAAVESYPVPSTGVFRLQGSGWGHGRGMSQWGAHQAATEGVTYQQILAFYYPGTALATIPGSTVRVLLTQDTGRNLIVRAAPKLTATYTTAAGRQRVVLPTKPKGCSSSATRWRARAVTTGVRLSAYCTRWVTVVPGSKVRTPTIGFEAPDALIGTQNGSSKRGYRGVVTASRTGSRSVQVINSVPMDQYLRTVVAAEVSPSWPVESLRAQAVAARSFSAHEALGRSRYAFDVYDSVRSQAYRAAVAYDSSWRVVASREHPATDAAIRATAGVHVVAAGVPALTQFGASNGGATAASPLSYMRAQADPWDAAAARNPQLAWTDSVSATALRARCSGMGTLSAVRVLAREGAGRWGGRIARLELVGSARTCTLSSDSAIRSAFGVNSSMFTILG